MITGTFSGSKARAPIAHSGLYMITCNYPAALCGDEILLCHALISCISWWSGWASGLWIQHAGDAAAIASGRIVSSTTGACYFTLVNLLSLILLFTSVAACWMQFKHPGRAACVVKETRFTPRQGWHLVQVTPVCRFLKQYWWQLRSICRLSSALPNPSQLTSGLGKQWRQDVLKVGQKYIFIAALYFHFIAKRLPLMKSFAAGAFPLVPKGKSVCGRGGRRTKDPNRRDCCFGFSREQKQGRASEMTKYCIHTFSCYSS